MEVDQPVTMLNCECPRSHPRPRPRSREFMRALPGLLLLIVSPQLQMGHAQTHEIAESLEVLAAQIDSNIQRLQTWEGSFELEEMMRETSTDDGTVSATQVFRATAQVRFSLDLTTSELYSAYRRDPRVIYENVTTGATVTRHEPLNVQSILTPEHFLRAFSNDLDVSDESRVARIAFRDMPAEADSLMGYSYVVDPRQMFQCGNRYISDIFTLNAKWLREGKSLPVVLRREAFGYSYLYEFPNIADGLEIHLDSTSGFHPVYAIITSGSDKRQFVSQWKYQKKGDLVVPIELTRIQRDRNGTVLLQRVLRLRESRLNEPIANGKFDLTAFGLQDGDQVRDKITNERKRFVDGTVISEEEYQRRASGNRWWRRAVMVAALVIGFAGIARLIWRQSG